MYLERYQRLSMFEWCVLLEFGEGLQLEFTVVSMVLEAGVAALEVLLSTYAIHEALYLWGCLLRLAKQNQMYVWFMMWTLAHVTSDIYLARLNVHDLEQPSQVDQC
eukprot:TRINITY_DN9531_c0_g2_i2.p1 TRINITY_DN9531_c0_g2~~TRINITY_DN9531_c0_g2_i2.p1  ORF type:complete len:106 (+),score=22.77 TRINITY_DN9531_c0_g2_i2:108-425(+)